MTHPYAPLRPGSYHDYSVTDFKGKWHKDSMNLEVYSRVPSSFAYQRATILKAGDMSAVTWFRGGVDITEINPSQTLYQEYGEQGIGECANNLDMDQSPGILLMQSIPVVGKEVVGASKVKARNPDGSKYAFTYPWRNRTLYVGPWGPWQDAIRTGLEETQGGQVYNYVFVRGQGICHFWYGVARPDGLIDGSEFYSVANG